MTYEEYFKNGDKFIYESIHICETIIYLVDITDINKDKTYMKIIFNRLGEQTKISSYFNKLASNTSQVYKVKELTKWLRHRLMRENIIKLFTM